METQESEETLERTTFEAPDLSKEFPPSPRDTSIAGYVIAARYLDKCRAAIAYTAGEYHSGCPLDQV